jgi:uncharacterized RDD family membrane protein YckC
MSDLPGQSSGTTGAPPGGGDPGHPQQQQPVAYSGDGPSGPRAGFWRRFAALLIDGIILGIVQGILTAILSDSVGVVYLLATLINWGYYTYFEGGPRGQTVGKMALGIRVYDFRGGGGPIGYGRAFVRQLVKIVSSIPIGLGYFWMLWDREKQTWHDKAAGSVVVPVDAYPVN